MSYYLLINTDNGTGVSPDKEGLLAAMKLDLIDLLPNNLWQRLLVNSTNDGKEIELFVGPVGVRTMLLRKNKVEHGALILEAAIACLLEMGVDPVVTIGAEGDIPPSSVSATMKEIVDAARKVSRSRSFRIRPQLYRCTAEVRLCVPLNVGSTGATATAFFQNCEVVGISERDVVRILRKDVSAKGDVLVAVQDVQVISFADVSCLLRGVTKKEGRIYFP